MKKFLILLAVLLFMGCNNKIESSDTNKVEIPKTTTTTKKIEKYVDDNPIKLGLYMYYNSNTNRTLVHEYTADWLVYTDICSLEVFFTNDEAIPGTLFQTMWPEYYNNYQNISNYKIGFNIEFDTINGHIKQNILSPSDTYTIFDYVQLYLYDDVHKQPGVWYSHITDSEFSNDSILSSIKLTGSSKIDEITSDIKVTVFTYDEDDFDEQNYYRGKSSYTAIIKRNN